MGQAKHQGCSHQGPSVGVRAAGSMLTYPCQSRARPAMPPPTWMSCSETHSASTVSEQPSQPCKSHSVPCQSGRSL